MGVEGVFEFELYYVTRFFIFKFELAFEVLLLSIFKFI
jgi:hypothetical protein